MKMKTNIPLILILVIFANFAYTCYPGQRYGPYGPPYGDLSHTRYRGDSRYPRPPYHLLGGHNGYIGGYRRYGRYRRYIQFLSIPKIIYVEKENK